jgi:hypothetical protein
MRKIKRIPYGKGDFEAINALNEYYVHKTMFIPELEQSSFNFLIRPRRFGKTILLSTLHLTMILRKPGTPRVFQYGRKKDLSTNEH